MQKYEKKLSMVIVGIILKSGSQTVLPLAVGKGTAVAASKLGGVALRSGEVLVTLVEAATQTGQSGGRVGGAIVRGAGGEGVAWLGEAGLKVGELFGWFGRPVTALRIGSTTVRVGEALIEGGAAAAKVGGAAIHCSWSSH